MIYGFVQNEGWTSPFKIFSIVMSELQQQTKDEKFALPT
jgi:hypothetical protein